MQNVLADLALESEAATATMARLARAYDEAQGDADARRFARLATAVCKYWLCKRAPVHAAEALECFGGNGFVEESMMPRLYREAPLNGIWEGSGNVICLDVLRAMQQGSVVGAAVLRRVPGGARRAAHRARRGGAAARARRDRGHRERARGASSSAWR